MRAFILIFVFGLLVSPFQVNAQEEDMDALSEQWEALFDEGRYKEALSIFQKGRSNMDRPKFDIARFLHGTDTISISS